MDDLDKGFISFKIAFEKMVKNKFGETAYCIEHFRTDQDGSLFLLYLLSGDSIKITLSRVEMMLYQRMAAMRLTINDWLEKRIESELILLKK